MNSTCCARSGVTVMNWQTMSILSASEVRDARVRRLDDELEPLRPFVAVRELLVGQLEETAGEELGHFDVEADELAVGVFIVPWRVGRAGTDDELAAIEHLLQAALRRILRQRRVRGKPRGNNRRAGEGRASSEQMPPVRERAL